MNARYNKINQMAEAYYEIDKEFNRIKEIKENMNLEIKKELNSLNIESFTTDDYITVRLQKATKIKYNESLVMKLVKKLKKDYLIVTAVDMNLFKAEVTAKKFTDEQLNGLQEKNITESLYISKQIVD